MSKQAAIYARVSTDDQRGNNSIPTQVSDCLKYAQEHQYLIVGNQFVNPETGRDTKKDKKAIKAFVDDYTSLELSRPGLNAALAFLETGGFDVLIVHALDRLARDPYIRQTLEREMQAHGVRVEYVLGSYDETPEGEVRKDLDATFAKWENTKRVERSTRGKRGKAARGLFVGGRSPLGYRSDPTHWGGLVIYELQAGIVRYIFELYVHEDYSIRAIADKLTKEKVLNHSGRTHWGKTTVARILANETYAGLCYYNKWKRKDKKLVRRSQTEWIPIKVPAIVERDVFEEAQRKLRQNHEIRRKQPKRFYLLARMVFCAKCGRVYVTQTKKPTLKNRQVEESQAYRHRSKEGHCTNKHIAARPLEVDVWGTIASAILDGDNLMRGYTESLERQKAVHAKKRSHLETLRQAAFKWEQKQENLTKAYIDPDVELSKAEYRKQKAVIQEELGRLEKEISELQEELDNATTPSDLASFEAFMAIMRREIEQNIDPDPLEKRRILEMLRVRVEIDPDTGKNHVRGWFKPGGNDSSSDSSKQSKQKSLSNRDGLSSKTPL